MASKPLPDWPRMMRARTAALYCDLAATKFLSEVAAGRLPLPVRLGDEDRWDRSALDADLNRLSGATSDWRKEQPGLAA